MSSMRDIAKITGLSIATISRHINKLGYVSKESAKIIDDAIKKLNYVPNQHAKAIFNKSSKIIGLVFPSLVNPFLAQMSTILGNLIQDCGFSTILSFTEDNAEKEKQALELLQAYRVDGIIIFRAINKDIIERLPFPVISVETTISDNIVTVSSDNEHGGRIAFEYLFNLGCKHLLHIKGPSQFEATEERCKGFLDAAKEKQYKVDLIQLHHDYSLNESIFSEFEISRFKKYDGIFVFNDINCLATVNFLAHNGLKVPEDIKVIGFDNSYLNHFIKPPFSTIEQSASKMSNVCFECLMSQINGEPLSEHRIRIPVRLIDNHTQ